MLKICLAVFLVALAVGCVHFDYEGAVDRSPDVEKELTVMTWNIWRGGTIANDRDWDGREQIIEMIVASGADVVLMQETYGFAEIIAERTGLMYYTNPKEWENLCIFSRYPIVYFKRHNDWNLTTAVIDVDGTLVQLADVWLDYRPDCSVLGPDGVIRSAEELVAAERNGGSRIRDVEFVLRELRLPMGYSSKIPLIMGGDFNSHSHLDWVMETRDILLFGHMGLVVPWEVSTIVAEAGFRDSFRELNPDLANPAGGYKNYGVSWLYGLPCRIDFIYYMGCGIEAVRSETFNAEVQTPIVFMGEEYLFPSDHGFVLTTFVINGV